MARALVIAVVAAVIGGAGVYGAMLYLGRSPVQVDVLISQQSATPVPEPSPAARPTSKPTAEPTLELLPTAIPTVRPTSTATPPARPTPTAIVATEREILVNAFAECNGKYSGAEKHRRQDATNSTIDRGLHSVASVRALVEQNCGGAIPELATAELPAVTAVATPTPAGLGTVAIPATATTPALPTIVAASPDERHLEEKRYMLELINAERKKAGVGTVSLGNNVAAQLHAESALENCFSSHWGMDGLKPYMRYSLAEGYQSNGENWSGLDYCIRSSDGYAPNSGITREIEEAMDGWMSSAGHRRNLLDPQHKKVNIGIAWDRYNSTMVQHFEGDYVEYMRLPTISDSVLSFSGRAKNSVQFSQEKDLGAQIYYDPPPHELARGQVARTYCYDNGRPVASLRWPLTGGYRWTTDAFSQVYKPCPSPYDVPVGAPAPRSPAEAHQAWQQAYSASQSRPTQSITVPWITASEWTANGTSFAMTADISKILQQYGDGVYSLMPWGKVDGEDAVISQYSIFHGVTLSDTYDPGDW